MVTSTDLLVDKKMNPIKPLYFKNKKELCIFFGKSYDLISKSIKIGKPLLNLKTGQTYTILKIY